MNRTGSTVEEGRPLTSSLRLSATLLLVGQLLYIVITQFGAALAVAMLALYGVLQAADGVANKEVDVVAIVLAFVVALGL